jgi:flagellar protein FliS
MVAMFTPVSTRSANSYRNLAVETSVSQANPHQLVGLLFEALLQSLSTAKGSMLNKDIPAKGRAINRAVRILEEGLKAGLDMEKGGELALNLSSLYDFCIFRVTDANLRNDGAIIDEVISLIRPVADGWTQIGAVVASQPRVG